MIRRTWEEDLLENSNMKTWQVKDRGVAVLAELY